MEESKMTQTNFQSKTNNINFLLEKINYHYFFRVLEQQISSLLEMIPGINCKRVIEKKRFSRFNKTTTPEKIRTLIQSFNTEKLCLSTI